MLCCHESFKGCLLTNGGTNFEQPSGKERVKRIGQKISFVSVARFSDKFDPFFKQKILGRKFLRFFLRTDPQGAINNNPE